MASDRPGIVSSIASPRLLLGPEPRHERTRHPSLESTIWKELRAFRDGARPYSDLRARWLTEYDRNQREALDALAQAIATRTGVSATVVRPLIVCLVIRF